MKLRNPLLVAALAAAIPAFAQQAAPPFGGSVSITGIATDVKGDNPFRLFEYRDIDDGVSLGLNVRGESNAWFYRVFGEHIGRDDLFLELKGGRYGVFKYTVYADHIIHNLTYGAITPFTGVGTNNLTFAGTSASTNIATWTPFDYSVQHKNFGGTAEATTSPDSPFYVRVTANRKKSEGLRPLGAPGTSPGGPTYELPVPVDFTTTDWSGEVGYSTRRMHLSANILFSKFEDHNDFLFWRTPIVATGPNIEASTIASDNEMWRLSLNGVFKQLPMNSTLALRGTYTKLENSFPIRPTYLSVVGTTGNNRLANPSSPDFEGEVVNKSFSAALNSSWARGLDSKVYYNWYERENNSHHIVFTPSGPGSGGTCDLNPLTGASAGPTCTTEFLHFTRKNVGVEVGWRFARNNRLMVGLDYLDVERERVDFDRAEETKATIEWKSGMFEVADVRLKYQRLERDSEFRLGASTNIFNRYVYRFDASPLDRDLFKLVIEGSPAPLLDLGVEFIYKKNDYRETVLGRTRDKREEVYVSASYGDPKALRVTAFADYERTSYDSVHWVGATTTFPNPNTAGTTFLWDANVHDKNHLFGIAAAWPFSDRLRLDGSFIWQKTDGGVNFFTPNNIANPQPILAYDSFRKKTLNLKGTFAATKRVDVTVGAAYEKYEFDDIQMNDYIYNIRTGTNQNYLSGAFAFPSYRASIVYATLTYRF
jgi:hypothetical protein